MLKIWIHLTMFQTETLRIIHYVLITGLKYAGQHFGTMQ